MKVIPLVVGVILIIAGLAEFIISISSISNDDFSGAGGFSLGLAFGFLVGLGLVVYAFVGEKTSPAELEVGGSTG
jgi:uncharacterized membrane protein HdeD (DUF308 family)